MYYIFEDSYVWSCSELQYTSSFMWSDVKFNGDCRYSFTILCTYNCLTFIQTVYLSILQTRVLI